MKLLLGLMICFSSLSFGQTLLGTAQGYMFFDTGAIFSVRAFFPSIGSDPLVQPYNAYNTGKKIEAMGTNYYIEADGTLMTFDQRGNAYETLDFLYKDKVKQVGGSYFFKKGQELNIVKTDGTIGVADISLLTNIRKVKDFGGLFMVSKKNDLYIVNPYDASVADLTNLFIHTQKDIEHMAHNYMLMSDGTIYTIGFKEIEERGVYKMIPVVKRNKTYSSRTAKLMGGNFFFDSSNHLHTIDYKGDINKGDTQRKMKVIITSIDKNKSSKKPIALGSNYFIYEDGEVYTVDLFGDLYFLNTLDRTQRISQTNIEIKE